MVRLVSLTFLVLAMLSGSASAECAWVLWEETETRQSHLWSLWEAYESKSDCVSRGRRAASRLAAGVGPGDGRDATKKLDDDTITTFDAEGKRLRYERFWCLPGATDPRPRFKE